MTRRKVNVKPVSAKAKNRFFNIMDSNPVCIIEQEVDGDIFLVSENQKYSFWMSTRTGSSRFGSKVDGHWEVVTVEAVE
jgi:lipocalin